LTQRTPIDRSRETYSNSKLSTRPVEKAREAEARAGIRSQTVSPFLNVKSHTETFITIACPISLPRLKRPIAT